MSWFICPHTSIVSHIYSENTRRLVPLSVLYYCAVRCRLYTETITRITCTDWIVNDGSQCPSVIVCKAEWIAKCRNGTVVKELGEISIPKSDLNSVVRRILAIGYRCRKLVPRCYFFWLGQWNAFTHYLCKSGTRSDFRHFLPRF